MNEPHRWDIPGAGAAAFDLMLSKGHAVEVTHRAPKWMCGRPVAIENEIYDRFVAWNAGALRRHQVAIDEVARLDELFEACGSTAYGSGGCFVCKLVDGQGYSGRVERHLLTLTNYGRPGEPIWLIHS